MNILNSLEQLTLGSPKPVEEVEELESEDESESESESESEDGYFGEPMVSEFPRYDSILFSHWFRRPGGPSPCLISAIEFVRSRDGDCDLCILTGVDRCCLHGTSSPSALIPICKDLVNNTDEVGCTIVHFGSLAFEDDFSTETNRKVFKIMGDSDFVEAIRDEEIAEGGFKKTVCVVG